MDRLEEWTLDGRRKTLACVMLFLASVLFYSPTLKFEFTKFDDHRIIGEHPQLYADGSVSERVQQIVFLDFPREEPLIVRDLSWLVDSVLFGFNRPFGYHYGNVFYHSLMLVLAFLLVLRLTNAATSLLAALMLLVLAAHVEPVAWVMGRKDVLSATFSLLCIHLFLQFQAAQAGSVKTLTYVASLLFAGAAFLSKINAVVLPGIVFLCALASNPTFRERGFAAPQAMRLIVVRLLQLVPFLIVALAIILWYRSAIGDFGMFDRNLEYSTEDVWRLVFFVNPLILVEYLRIVFVPWNLEALYTEPSIFTELSKADMAWAILFIALFLAAIVFLWRFNRVACLLFLCFALAMLPYQNWVNYGFWYANRYVYFASIFLVAAFANVALSIWQRSGRAPLKVIPIVIVTLVLLQNLYYRTGYLSVWENGESLWEHEISLPSASIQDYNNLTANYIGRAEDTTGVAKERWLEKASAANDAAFELDVPPHERVWVPIAHYYKGLILAYSHAPLEAQLEQFLTAVNTSDGFYNAQWSTAVVYYQMALQESDPVQRAALAEESLIYARHFFKESERAPQIEHQEALFWKSFENDFPEVRRANYEAAKSQ